MRVSDYRRAAEDPAVVAAVAALLAGTWDPGGALRTAAGGAPDFYAAHALTLTAMAAADARETELARYLRQTEQQLLGATLHPFSARAALSVAIWRTVRGPVVAREPT